MQICMCVWILKEHQYCTNRIQILLKSNNENEIEILMLSTKHLKWVRILPQNRTFRSIKPLLS